MSHNPQSPPQRSPYLVERLLGDETAIDTLTATVALRDQMKLEMYETEETERRKAVAESRAPNQQANFLLAASFLVQEYPLMTAAEAIAEIRSRFVESKVKQELQQIRDKWHGKIFYRPKSFEQGDAAEKMLIEQQAELIREEREDIAQAQDIVYKLCNFLTCSGKLLDEWKTGFNAAADLAGNQNIWKPKQFDKVVIEIGQHVMGTEVPEGLAKTIYDFLDQKSQKLLHIDVFYQAVNEAATHEKNINKNTIKEIKSTTDDLLGQTNNHTQEEISSMPKISTSDPVSVSVSNNNNDSPIILPKFV